MSVSIIFSGLYVNFRNSTLGQLSRIEELPGKQQVVVKARDVGSAKAPSLPVE